MKQILIFYLLIVSITSSQDYWVKINSEIQNASSVVVRANGDIFAGSFGNGVFYSSNNGNSWEMANQGLTDLHINTLFINYSGDHLENPNGDIFAATSSGIFRSSDDANKWANVNNTIENIVSLAINSVNDLYAASCGRGIFLSYNYGAVWHEMNNGVLGPTVQSIAINSIDEIFVGTDHCVTGCSIYRSNDNGESWEIIHDNLSISDLKINKQGDIFAATRFKGIYRSTDNGDNWTKINNGLTDTMAVYCLEISPNEQLYAGTEKGIFYSDDNGDSWENISKGLEFNEDGYIYINSIAVDSSMYMYTACREGVYRSINPVTSIQEDQLGKEWPTNFQLSQNYPNPFNPSTTIKYTIPAELQTKNEKLKNVTLKIFDLLGREVAILVNEKQIPGIYEVKWDASDRPSGVYFYKLSTENHVSSRKMLLIK